MSIFRNIHYGFIYLFFNIACQKQDSIEPITLFICDARSISYCSELAFYSIRQVLHVAFKHLVLMP